MKRASELGLEVIQLEEQVLLINKNHEYQTIGWAYNSSKGVFWVSSSDRYPEGYEFIASSKQLDGLPLLVIEDEVENLAKEYTGDEMGRDDKKLFAILCHFGRKLKESHPRTDENLLAAFQAGQQWHQDLINDAKQTHFPQFLKELDEKELWIEVEYYDPLPPTRQVGVRPKIENNQIKAVWK